MENERRGKDGTVISLGSTLQGPSNNTTPEAVVWEVRRVSRIFMPQANSEMSKAEATVIESESTIVLAVVVAKGGEKRA